MWSSSEVMKMTNKTNGLSLVLFLLVSVGVTAGMVYGLTFTPSAPSGMANVSVNTTAYPNGWDLNLTRSHIYTVDINESQPTLKWTGIVGNISAEFALQDEDDDALFDWPILSTTGEVYATRETSGGGGWSGGGIPSWSAMYCANSSMISDEGIMFNSTNASEDSMVNTFTTSVTYSTNIYIGEFELLDAAHGEAGGCYGLHLNENNSDVTDDWIELVLTDNASESEDDLPDGMSTGSGAGTIAWNIIYASVIMNHSFGYNGEIYDFQMLLPQLGQAGDVAVIPFYFYIELV